jgi:hypothetical protein
MPETLLNVVARQRFFVRRKKENNRIAGKFQPAVVC